MIIIDQLVLPVLLYGSEVWCFTKIDQIEIFYKNSSKNYWVPASVLQMMVYGETGTTPVLKKSLVQDII